MRRSAPAVLVFLFAAAAAQAQEVTGSSAVTAQYRDPETIERITLRLAGYAQESWDTVLADGEPPLTWGTVATLSLLLHETYDAQMSEAEAELVAKGLATAYDRSDEAARRALVNDWQAMLGGGAGSKAKLEARIDAAVKSNAAWAMSVRDALERRRKILRTSTAARPAWAANGFDTKMSVADLDAGIELLYFMWVASGRNPEYVTLEGVAQLRAHFLNSFAELPPDLQYALANAQKIYAGLRVLWYTGGADQRQAMASDFNAELNALGLPDPDGNARSGDAWSDVNGKSRGDFAAEMVVGLAGSSYKSAW
jgi:hypothetical protein